MNNKPSYRRDRFSVWSELCECIYEQTHYRQCCNLLISWLWTVNGTWLFCLVWCLHPYTLVCDDQSTVAYTLNCCASGVQPCSARVHCLSN